MDDLAPWSRAGIRVTLFCFILNMFDGVNIFTLTYVAPALQKHFAANPEQFSWAFSAGLFGMAIGGIALAPQADRYGRKPILIGAFGLMGAAMVASAFAPSLQWLVAARLLVGVGIGTVLASLSALSAAFAPARFRNFAVGLPQAGYPIGATIAGFATAWALPIFGWSSIFIAAGSVTLALLPFCFLLLPEAPEAASSVRYSIAEAVGGGRRRTSSILLWVCTVCGFMALYFIASWITKLAIAAGLQTTQAILASAIYNAGAFLGTVLVSAVSIRVNIRILVAVMLACTCVLFLIFGGVKMPIAPLLVTSFLIGVTLQGGVNGLYPLTASAYPPEARATGLGWAMGIGRGGALLGPMIGGWALTKGLPLVGVFGIFCAPLLLTSLAASRVRNSG